MSPREAMQLAIAEGRRGAGFVSPNPLVGAVILNARGELIAKGYHAKWGDLHAETAALKNVKDPKDLEGAHLFCTLEPCAHQGRQPSCAETLAALPIASVTYGMLDPNPLVAGQGAKILSDAGKKVEVFLELQNELEELAEIFLLNMRLGRPFVSLKIATSMDGQVALEDGSSQWITGAIARERVQTLRGEYDAVLTGVGTFLKDNPRLNSRDARFKDKKQRVILLDPDGFSLEKLLKSQLLSVRAAADVILATKKGVRPPAGVQHLEFARQSNGDFDLVDILRELKKSAGLQSVFVEAGAHTASSFLKAGLVDRLFLFMAPKLLGRGLGWTSGFAIAGLDQAVQLTQIQAESLGDDWLLNSRPRFP